MRNNLEILPHYSTVVWDKTNARKMTRSGHLTSLEKEWQVPKFEEIVLFFLLTLITKQFWPCVVFELIFFWSLHV